MLPARTYQVLRAFLSCGTEVGAAEMLGITQNRVSQCVVEAGKICPGLPFALGVLRELHRQQRGVMEPVGSSETGS